MIVLCNSDKVAVRTYNLYKNILAEIGWSEKRNIKLVTKDIPYSTEEVSHIVVIEDFKLIYELMFDKKLDISRTEHLIVIGFDDWGELFKEKHLFHINSMIDSIPNFIWFYFFFPLK